MKKLLIILLLTAGITAAQDADSIEVFLINSFVTPEKPNTFKLSFFTSSMAKSKVIIDETYDFNVSDEYTENHEFEIQLKEMNLNKKVVPFLILVEDSAGNANTSELYDFDLPSDVDVREESNFLLFCLFGGAVFVLPSPTYVSMQGENYFSLSKEIPLLSFRGGFNYPSGYISAEYSHIFNAPSSNFLRLGYKQIMEIPYVEYIAPGINGFTDFTGFNGLSPELSVGWIKLFNTFTLYSRYRYNFMPGKSGAEFHEVSIGLYSSFFSLYF